LPRGRGIKGDGVIKNLNGVRFKKKSLSWAKREPPEFGGLSEYRSYPSS
jgi:hypothetical protein